MKPASHDGSLSVQRHAGGPSSRYGIEAGLRLTTLLRRGWLSLVMIAVMMATPVSAPVTVAQAQVNPTYASIVVDAETGEVLFARYADNRRYPASVTKVMTLYMAFEALADGRARLDDVITVSPRAASQPPSKLGLAAGQTITLEDAMKATAVRSANDMAVAIAEHIGGSEARFTAQMTLKAQELGMTHTRYVNANGLPDARQLTTARDLAVLGRAVMRDYPQYYRFFGIHDWVYNGRNYTNTNGLLRTGGGYDGMKTGLTNASGSNIMASAVRDGKRIITVVLGGQSTASRNAHVAALTDTGFEVVRLRRQGERIQVAQLFFEQRGFGNVPGSNMPSPSTSGGPVQYASVSDEADDAELTTILNGGVAPAAGATPAPPATRSPPARTPPRAPARPAREPAREPAGRWTVQVGAFRDETVARNWLAEVNRRYTRQFAGAERNVQSASGWYRSRFTGMTEAAARAACEALAERRWDCTIIRPE